MREKNLSQGSVWAHSRALWLGAQVLSAGGPAVVTIEDATTDGDVTLDTVTDREGTVVRFAERVGPSIGQCEEAAMR